ncbi:Arm DNA-binding domain-containing protein [Pseudomonas rubra]|uniref:DUF3596 domain-containing protein n=1 Tax=Pseudomonas rubra TaxID=2942627 RepID=A0ABT5P916_9PSED|nr:DUF3596 domain-containing protein [Pseudomonas rubra]MDD1014790.1 DUF3596 domain-containing protein [Pseudomonas rubra]MDD1040761.1 DUF3596 domain-containing protein [Pseudomonas rubra]MDD1157709.1 DUF3596 domain-containing protein [Pseudomonas rubra]
MNKKLPAGIELNGKRLRISFMFNGQRCREPLKNITKVDSKSIAYAENKRRTILTEIREGRFDYAAHFPESTLAAALSGIDVKTTKSSVQEGINSWLEIQQVKRAKSTYINYVSKAKHVSKKFGKRRIADVGKRDLELFQAMLLRDGLSSKTVNDIFTIIRGVWTEAFEDEIIKTNPTARIRNIERDDEIEFADPFTREELNVIANSDPSRAQDVRMILFNCWVGLSVSELVALAKEDVDLENGGIHVRRAKVSGEFKVPKERSRVRFVELISPAYELLQQILVELEGASPEDIEVTQRDAITTRQEKITLLFRNSISQHPWNGRTLSAWFTRHLKLSKVRHRGANQCRHTFASQTLSSYVPIEWVARQLGHSDTTMVKKHYGRWLKDDTKSMAATVSQMMGFKTE